LEIIRAFTPNDIDQAANLFQKVFRHNLSHATTSLRKYFHDLYFEHPWYREDMPSHVYETSDGKIAGFLGVLPLHMKFGRENILAGIGGNYMVDPDLKNPFAGPKILKKFLSGPQVLSMSDTGNEVGRKMWEGLGGTVSYLQSLHWIRPLRPAQLALTVAQEKSSFLKIAGMVTQPLGYLLDGFSTTWTSSPLHLGTPSGYVKEITTHEILDSIQAVSSKYSLVPVYSEETLHWILTKALEKQEFGLLRMMGVYTPEHSLSGWFLYYPNPGKIGQVIQVGTRSRSMSNVLDHLFCDALEMKSIALIGRIDAAYMKEFSAKLCLLFHRSNYFVMHSQRTEILLALHSGDTFLTRLEGEWWTRLQGDTFQEGGHPFEK
jgi:hypothetical protein